MSSTCSCCHNKLLDTNLQSEGDLSQSSQSNYLKMELMKRDKALMTYSKSLSTSKNQIDLLQGSISQKEKDIADLKATIKNLQNQIEQNSNQFKENDTKFNEYQKKINEEKLTSAQNLKEQTERYNETMHKLEIQEAQMNNLIFENDNLQTQLKKEKESKLNIEKENAYLKSKLDGLLYTLENLKNENKEISGLYNKINTYEHAINSLNNELTNDKNYIEQLHNELNNVNNNIEITNSNFSEKETQYRSMITELKQDLQNAEYNFNVQNEELKKQKHLNEKLTKDNDFMTFYITQKSNDFLEFLNNLANNAYINPNTFNNQKKTNDIKFEIIDDIFLKLYKKTYDFTELHKNIQSKFINEFSVLDKEKKQSEENTAKSYNEIQRLNNINNELNNKVETQNQNFNLLNESFIQLKETYTSLFNDYESFTQRNETFVNETQNFLVKLNGKFENLNLNLQGEEPEINSDGNNNMNNIEKREEAEVIESVKNNNLKDVVLSNLSILIDEYLKVKNELNDSKNEIKEHTQKIDELKQNVSDLENEINVEKQKHNENINQQKETTMKKIKEITSLLDESKAVIEEYQNEIQNLKNENEKINYRYKMALSSQMTEPNSEI